MAKVTIATDWLAACAGCHMSLLDIDERIVPLMEMVDFTSSPVTDLKHPPADGVTVGILTGAISNTHNIEVARLMRSRCKISGNREHPGRTYSRFGGAWLPVAACHRCRRLRGRRSVYSGLSAQSRRFVLCHQRTAGRSLSGRYTAATFQVRLTQGESP